MNLNAKLDLIETRQTASLGGAPLSGNALMPVYMFNFGKLVSGP